MLGVFRALLRLYPFAYREEFAEEMLTVLTEVHRERKTRSSLARAIYFCRESAGLVGGAIQEHTRSLLGSLGSSIFPTRRLTMRSEFRFPKATLTLMALILLGILLAMDKARAIQASGPYPIPQVGPIRSADFSLFIPLLLGLGIACAAGALGWAILFALHRSGIHRLAEVDPSSAQPASRK